MHIRSLGQTANEKKTQLCIKEKKKEECNREKLSFLLRDAKNYIF
jgi:hypothetical protein